MIMINPNIRTQKTHLTTGNKPCMTTRMSLTASSILSVCISNGAIIMWSQFALFVFNCSGYTVYLFKVVLCSQQQLHIILTITTSPRPVCHHARARKQAFFF